MWAKKVGTEGTVLVMDEKGREHCGLDLRLGDGTK